MHETGSVRGPIRWKRVKLALDRLVISPSPIFLDLSIHCIAALPIPCTSFFRVSYGTTNLWRANPLVAKVCCQGPPPSIYLTVSFSPNLFLLQSLCSPATELQSDKSIPNLLPCAMAGAGRAAACAHLPSCNHPPCSSFPP